MSLFNPITVTCPSCAHLWDIDAVGSVNADRRPDLRDEILAGRFQVFACPACAEELRLSPHFNYLDMALGLWLAVHPPQQIGRYPEIEDTTTALFAESYGAGASPSAREVGGALAVRLTFGWPATREKLLLRKNHLEDVAVEMLKLDLLRRLPEAPLRPGVELRLVDIFDDGFGFAWIDTATEEVLAEFQASKKLLSDIQSDPAAWEPTRQSLTSGPFVDIQKLYLGAGRNAA